MTKKELEAQLNEELSLEYTEDEALKQFARLGSNTTLRKHYWKETLGTLLRKKDPVCFILLKQEREER